MNMSMHYLLYAALALYCAGAAARLFRLVRPAAALIGAGFVIHTAYQAWRGWMTGVFIVNNLFDPVPFLPWCLALLIVANSFKPERRDEWLSLAALLAAFSLFAMFYPKGIIPPTPKKITVWAALFFLFEVMSHALFYAGAWFAWRQRNASGRDATYHTLLIWGFLLYSAVQVAGAAWSWLGWGTTFRWGSRHIFSAALWCYYALYIHLRYMQEWSVRGRALYASFGGIVVLLLSFASYVHEMLFPRIGG